MLTTHTHAAGGVCSSPFFSRYAAALLRRVMRLVPDRIELSIISRVLPVWILALGLLILVPARLPAQTFSDPGFVSDTIVTLPPYSPVGLTFAPDGRMFVWQENGVVRVFKNGALLPTPFIDISSHVNSVNDRGLLGLALHPDFSNNGYVYLLYTYENAGNPNDSSPKTARLTRVKADPANPDVAIQGSEVVLLGSIGTGPCSNYPDGSDCIGSDSDSHTIGTLRFAPDGKLFVGSGDGASYADADPLALRAQNLNSLNGKLLRINADGTAPSDNPFYDSSNPNSNRSKVYAYGLRNPYRFGLHPVTGEPYIGDVGWEKWEEVDRGRGANFGWPCYEGNGPQLGYQAYFTQCQQLAQSDTTAPLFTYDHATGRAIIGGHFYTATQFPTQYRNTYFFADYTGGWIRRMVFDAGNNVSSIESFATDIDGLVSLEFGPDGSLYYISLPNGEVRRIRYASAPTAKASVNLSSGYSPLTVSFSSAGSSDPNNSALAYLWEFGDGTTSTNPNPTKTYTVSGVKTFTAKLTVTNAQNVGSSSTLTIVVGSSPPTATITAPQDAAIFPAGTIVTYRGSATDPDETLAPGALNWSVLLHHDDHVHPYLTSTGPSGSFVVETHGAGTYFYEIILTAIDSSGLKNTKRVNINIGSSPLPSPWLTEDIGTVGVAGSASYSSNTFTVKGSGDDIWGIEDSFRYVYRPFSGNNEIIARVVGLGNTDPWAKAGLMIRETLNPDSRHASIYLTPENGVAFQRRATTGGSSTHTAGSQVTGPYWVRLVRNGSSFTAYESADGTNWTLVGTDVINMASNVYIGLAVLSHDNSALSTATIEVTYADVPPLITSPIPPAVVNVNAAYNHSFTATGSPAPAFGVTAGSLPPGLSLSSSGLLSGAPSNPGTYNITVTASNGVAPAATQSFSIKVNGPPVAVSDSYSTSRNTALTVSAPGVLGNDNDPNGDPLTALLVSNPAHGTVSLNVQGSFTYTPAASFTGTDSFTYKAFDGQLDSSAATVTITVNSGGTLAFNAAAYTVSENGGTIQVTVTRTGGTSGAATVNYATGNGTASAGSDYTAASGTLSFAAGETSKSFNITIINDSVNEPDETVNLTLSNVTGSAVLGTPGNSVLTITDNDPVPTLSIAGVSINEGNSGTSNALFTVSLSAASGRPISVAYATADATATAAGDYVNTSGTLTFNPGEISKSISVPVNGDVTFEADETFTIALTNPTNAALAAAVGTGRIINDDAPPTISINNRSVTEGNAGTVIAGFTVSLSTAIGLPVSVNYATADGTAASANDYASASGTLTFNPGETSKTISVTINGDVTVEADETFTVTLSAPTNATLATAVGTGTIINDDVAGTLRFSNAAYSINEGAGTATITVIRTLGSSGTVTINYATSNGTATAGEDYVAASGTLTFGNEETSKSFTVSINDDHTFEGDETFNLTLSNVTGGALTGTPATAVVTITENDPPLPVLQFSQASYVVAESAGFLNITVTRNGDLSAPASVKYATNDSTDANFRCDPTTPGQATIYASRKCDYHIAAGTLRFAAGEETKQFTLSIVDDVYVENPEAFTLTLSNPAGGTLGQTSTATVTITDNDTYGTANPIDTTGFFVRQLYVDLLSREPDPAGLNGWTTRIDRCGQPGQPPPPCDRVTVAGDGFLRSGEFFDRQFFVLRLYRTGLGRILRYDEIADLAYVSGFLTASDLELNKVDLVADIMSRTEFANRYNGLSNAQFVDTLLQTAGVTVPQATRDGWVAELNATTKTRAQVYREISERPEVSNRYLHEAQVVSAYYGFFTRNPDGAYLTFLQRLDSGEITLGDLANAFINAGEYRQRFGH
jgi:glucose/arabinose dehydrogenase